MELVVSVACTEGAPEDKVVSGEGLDKIRACRGSMYDVLRRD